MSDIEEVSKQTKVLDTKELIVSKGFLAKLGEYFEEWLKILHGERDNEMYMEKKE